MAICQLMCYFVRPQLNFSNCQIMCSVISDNSEKYESYLSRPKSDIFFVTYWIIKKY